MDKLKSIKIDEYTWRELKLASVYQNCPMVTLTQQYLREGLAKDLDKAKPGFGDRIRLKDKK